MQISARGTWPGPVTLRQGWAKAVAREWNEDVPDAQLRLVRGSSGFITAATRHLLDSVVLGVTSPPLPEMATTPWRRAGYQDYLTLDLFSMDLNRPLDVPAHEVRTDRHGLWDEAVAIDQTAFPVRWRLGSVGLSEARDATARSAFLTLEDGSTLAGFAIAGVSGPVSYLQRVAVKPEMRGRGFGRSLVRACARWGRARGGRSIMLNTQPDNEAAAALYRSEGFRKLPNGLKVLRFPGPLS